MTTGTLNPSSVQTTPTMTLTTDSNTPTIYSHPEICLMSAFLQFKTNFANYDFLISNSPLAYESILEKSFNEKVGEKTFVLGKFDLHDEIRKVAETEIQFNLTLVPDHLIIDPFDFFNAPHYEIVNFTFDPSLDLLHKERCRSRYFCDVADCVYVKDDAPYYTCKNSSCPLKCNLFQSCLFTENTVVCSLDIIFISVASVIIVALIIGGVISVWFLRRRSSANLSRDDLP